MVNITKDLTKVNFTKYPNRQIKYIVIHYTAGANDKAWQNANYFRNEFRGASAHYFVDETSIYQVVDDKDVAWSVGKNYGTNNLFGTVTNYNSISIEMCGTNSAVGPKTFDTTVELTKQLMKKYNIPANNVYRHYDVCSKQCPGWANWGTRKGDPGLLWIKFKNALVNKTSSTQAAVPSNTHVKPDIIYAVKAGGKWYPEVKNYEDYAGVENKAVTDVMIKLSNGGKLSYRVHILGGKWLPYVTGYNKNDSNNGYAGCGKVIDAIELKCASYNIKYRVSTTKNGANYYAEVLDNDNDYAGVFGKPIDKIQCRVI